MDPQPNPSPNPAPFSPVTPVSSGSHWQPPTAVALQPPPQPIVIHLVNGWFSRWLGVFGWLAFFICLMFLIGQWMALGSYFNAGGMVMEKFHSGEAFGHNKVAVIDISGVIMEGDGFVKQQIDQIRDDDSVKGVVVRVDSPGGTVTGSDYIFHHLKRLRKERQLPMVVSMGSMAASGGYYVSMAVGDQEKVIFAEPTTTTGSIGVIMPHYDVSGLMARFDVKDDSIATHPRKQMLSMTKPLSDEDRQILQQYIGESFARFTDIVKEGRPAFAKDEEALKKLATGEVFTANQAKKHGLVDEVGFIEDAIDRVIQLAHLDKSTVRIVQFERPPTLFGLGAVAQSRQPNELAALLELSAPRAYYLATNLPTLLTSRKAD